MPTMKVFISHSSKDRWIAERIKEGLERIELDDRGVKAFLSSDDIEDGAKFKQLIRDALVGSDEVALLVSAASLKSQWVVFEQGLWEGNPRKEGPLVPILISGVSPPDLLRELHCEELNNIERYYRGVKRRLRQKVFPPSLPKSFEVGDLVSIVGPTTRKSAADPPLWVDGMNQYKMEVTRVVEVRPRVKAASLEIDDGYFPWAFRWLEKVGRADDKGEP